MYRAVKTDVRTSDDFVDSFKSRTELGRPPRRGTPEEAHPELADGISVFLERGQAAATAVAVKARIEATGRGEPIGDYTAKLDLSGSGVDVSNEWGSPGHLTVWGDSTILSELATDIVPIEVTRQ